MEQAGYSYARYDNPTAGGAGRTGDGARRRPRARWPAPREWTAVQMAVETALTDRRASIVAADALYGASTTSCC